jgi:hypothetical protein
VALDGGDVGPEYERRWQEWRDLEIQKITNPLFAYTPEQSEIAEGRLLEKVQGSILTRETARVYKEAGGGPAGYAAARRFLSDAVDGRPPQSRAGPMTGFVSPVEGGRVSSGFGPRAAPVAGASTDHNGIDFAVPKGTPVKAAAPGVVVSVSEDGASGKFVRIRHPDGTISGYAHLDMQDVQRGQLVKQGDIIGASGSTGTTSGPNLHFTLSKDGKAIDPAALLDRPGPEALAGAAAPDAAADPILAEIPAPRRMRLYRTTSANLDALYAGERATAQAEAAAEREEQAAEREAADSWRLRVVLGEASEADVNAATNIDDGTKASLITGVRALARSEASAARAEAAATRTASVATYNQYADLARAGNLPEAEIADAVQAGFLTAGQARTLSTTRDRVLGPAVKDVMAPVRDAAKAPGRGTRGTAASLARADELAARWARDNPGATFEQRIDAGKKIAAEVFKPPATAGGGAAAAQRAALDRRRALDARYKRGEIKEAEYKRLRKELDD